ncbi:MAG TPA: hypothetical protein VL947_14165, partial [Cytophagales bacterium]|nr:hypothetical protein [Cytophagales bacterium]
LIEIAEALGTTLVFVTHTATDALSVATRVIVLDEGRIVQSDVPTRIYYHPKNRAVGEISGELMELDASVLAHFGLSDKLPRAFARPSAFAMAKAPEGHIVRVEQRFFYGDSYKYYFKVGDKSLFLYSSEVFEPATKIYVKLLPEGLIQFD